LKHSGEEPHISIEHGLEDNAYVIRVRDKGPGIPEDMLEKIFSKYTRLHKSDQQNAGTGLGLAITRNVMQTLQGEVSVNNETSGGAVFTLRLPR
ncbi:MAG: ATP-binding protein, partial [Asticcacaulis sp.]|nr:ATP-binding protein [Asticcacaulis sp.]